MADVLRDLAPDLVVLQEAPRLLGWQLARSRLARRTGLRPLTPGPACGNLLLARPPVGVRAAGVLGLPRRPGLHRRAAVHATLDLDLDLAPGRDPHPGPARFPDRPALLLAGTHLDLEPAARLDSARRVRSGLPAGALVLGADVNDEPGSPPWAVLADGVQVVAPGPTFPAAAPRRVLDALFVDPGLTVRSAEVVDTGAASDHRAVRAELAWT